METEKFDLDETQELGELKFDEIEGPDSGHVTGTLDDDEYIADNEDLPSQFEFIKEMLGDDALDDKRNTYGLKADNDNYPHFDFETKGGKTVSVRHDNMGTMWRICFVPGGQLPQELDGGFTTQDHAIQAVKLYLAKQ